MSYTRKTYLDIIDQYIVCIVVYGNVFYCPNVILKLNVFFCVQDCFAFIVKHTEWVYEKRYPVTGVCSVGV